jgi:hypothetical protein
MKGAKAICRPFIGAPLAASRDPSVITRLAVVGLGFASFSFSDDRKVSRIYQGWERVFKLSGEITCLYAFSTVKTLWLMHVLS